MLSGNETLAVSERVECIVSKGEMRMILAQRIDSDRQMICWLPPSHAFVIDFGLYHVTSFGQWAMNKCNGSKALISTSVLGISF